VISRRARQLAALHARMRACRRCLAAGYTITPPAIFSGSHSARIMVIGQAPGSKEVAANRPFHAGSGARLFQWLGRAGFDEAQFRREQYITSVTKCFPGKAPAGSGDRVPTRAERDLCRPFLDEQLHLIDPEVILLVGRLAVDAILPGAGRFEDVIGTTQRVDGRWVLPLPHPSGASRWHQSDGNRARIDAAIRRLARLRNRLKL